MAQMNVQYVASDGTKFDNKNEAARYERLVETKKDFDHARCKFAKALAESQKTADGYLFDLDRSTYYWVSPAWAKWPQIVKVRFYPWSIEINPQDVTIIWSRKDGEWKRYPTSELYARESNAAVALIKEQERFIRERQEDLERTREEYGIQERER